MGAYEITDKKYIGLSTTEKPLDVPNGATFYEADTGYTNTFFDGTWYCPENTSDNG